MPRFKPGESGNPKGRAPGGTSLVERIRARSGDDGADAFDLAYSIAMDEGGVDESVLREKLQGEVGRVSWRSLVPHQQRGHLWLLEDLDLVSVGLAVAMDQLETVSGWTQSGRLRRERLRPGKNLPESYCGGSSRTIGIGGGTPPQGRP